MQNCQLCYLEVPQGTVPVPLGSTTRPLPRLSGPTPRCANQRIGLHFRRGALRGNLLERTASHGTVGPRLCGPTGAQPLAAPGVFFSAGPGERVWGPYRGRARGVAATPAGSGARRSSRLASSAGLACCSAPSCACSKGICSDCWARLDRTIRIELPQGGQRGVGSQSVRVKEHRVCQRTTTAATTNNSDLGQQRPQRSNDQSALSPPGSITHGTTSSPALITACTRSGSAFVWPSTPACSSRPSLWLPRSTVRQPFSTVHLLSCEQHSFVDVQNWLASTRIRVRGVGGLLVLDGDRTRDQLGRETVRVAVPVAIVLCQRRG